MIKQQKTMTVTPALAAEWLARNRRNMPVRKDRVALIAKDLEATGKFQTNAPITLFADGRSTTATRAWLQSRCPASPLSARWRKATSRRPQARSRMGQSRGLHMAAVKLAISKLRTDGGTQPRSALNMPIVEDYAAAMRAGAKFPAVDVFYDGTDYWLADGFHRCRAAYVAEFAEIAATVHQGTLRDAQWFSYARTRRTASIARTRTSGER